MLDFVEESFRSGDVIVVLLELLEFPFVSGGAIVLFVVLRTGKEGLVGLEGLLGLAGGVSTTVALPRPNNKDNADGACCSELLELELSAEALGTGAGAESDFTQYTCIASMADREPLRTL